MLSILIPTYNYSAFPLVQELWNQATETGINFEIIVLDDASNDPNTLAENTRINTLEHSRFERNETNVGRAKNLNKLAQKAQYHWLLMMDCDTLPKSNQFIANYLKAISESKNDIFFGGIVYDKAKPETVNLLRWKYGSNREEIKVEDRIQNPYSTTLTSNILIKKEVFDAVKFDERIAEYGYEDLVFIQNLKVKKHLISHIDNPTYHLNYETSAEFLSKTKKALETLKFIEEQQLLNSVETKIQKSYHFLAQLKLNKLVGYLFKKFQPAAEKNLLSNRPSLLVFDLYKLGYFSSIKSN